MFVEQTWAWLLGADGVLGAPDMKLQSLTGWEERVSIASVTAAAGYLGKLKCAIGHIWLRQGKQIQGFRQVPCPMEIMLHCHHRQGGYVLLLMSIPAQYHEFYSFVLRSRSSPTKWGKVSSLSSVGIYGGKGYTAAILVLVMEGSLVQLLHLFKLACDSPTAW